VDLDFTKRGEREGAAVETDLQGQHRERYPRLAEQRKRKEIGGAKRSSLLRLNSGGALAGGVIIISKKTKKREGGKENEAPQRTNQFTKKKMKNRSDPLKDERKGSFLTYVPVHVNIL